MCGYVKKFRGVDKKFYFTVHAGNHRAIVTSEGYNSKASRQKGITVLRETFGDLDKNYTVVDKDD